MTESETEQRVAARSGKGWRWVGPAAWAASVPSALPEGGLQGTDSIMGPGPGGEMTPFIVLLCHNVIWIQIDLKFLKENLFGGLSGQSQSSVDCADGTSGCLRATWLSINRQTWLIMGKNAPWSVINIFLIVFSGKPGNIPLFILKQMLCMC